MAGFVHGLLICLYVATAAIVALHVPGRLALPANAALPLALAAATLGGLAIVHAVFVGIRGRLDTRRELRKLQKSYSDVMRELGYARAEVVQIHDALEAAHESRSNAPDIREVANEVKTLQGQIETLNKAEEETRAQRRASTRVKPSGEMLPVAENLDDARILDIVREGIELDRVDLYLQPIVSLPQRKHRFYECFSRIRDGEGNVIVPEQYLSIAEREGLIAAIDNVLLMRCIQLVRKVQKKSRRVGFFVNISAHTLADTQFFREFTQFMGENYELAPYIIFEFAQDDVQDIPQPTAASLLELGTMGFRFSLDRVSRLDMNYAEMSRRFFRYIKIDCQTLIKHLAEQDGDDNMRAFKGVLESQGIDAVVERVEAESEILELLDYGVDFGQGYLFGEPRLAR